MITYKPITLRGSPLYCSFCDAPAVTQAYIKEYKNVQPVCKKHRDMALGERIVNRSIPLFVRVFNCRARAKLLHLLSQEIELNITEICTRCGLNSKTATHHLKFLRDMKLIEEKIFGRMKIYRYKIEDSRLLTLQKLFLEWEA